MSRDIPPYGLRMQPSLKAAIEEAAKKHGRSMNAEIVARLEQSVEEDRKHELADNKDPFALIVQATEGIGRMAALINKALIPLGVESGRIDVQEGETIGEGRGRYGSVLDLLPEDDRQILSLFRQMKGENRETLLNLVRALQKNKGGE